MWKMQILVLLLVGLCLTGNVAVAYTGCYPNPPQEIYTIFNMEGDISSPGYTTGTPYPNDLQCGYTIKAPFGYKIRLEFTDFDIDPFDMCMKDVVAVHDGDNPYGPLHGIFCGNETPNALLSVGNAIHISFRTDFLGGKKGFKIHYKAALGHLLCPLGKSVCKNRNCYTISQICNGEDECGDGTDEEGCGKPGATINCGLTPITPLSSYFGRDRIIGGQEVKPGSWPWQADLQLRFYEPNGHMCGGTLISAQWVVSAAHCFQGNPRPEEWRIHFGNHHKFKKDPYEQVRHVERIIVYPGITGNQLQGQLDMENDIALIKLSAPVKFTDQVRPACLPSQGHEVTVGTKCVATGWGTTRGTGKANVLKQVDLSIQRAQDCTTNTSSFNNKTMICVKNEKGFQDVCHGDSGGPLVCKTGDTWTVMGATSFGTAHNYESGLCALPEARTVYSKISDKVSWIITMINKYS